jgi:hypothetical protein
LRARSSMRSFDPRRAAEKPATVGLPARR